MMRHVFWIFSITILLSACADNGMNDIKQFMKEADRKAANVKVEEPIEFQSYETFSYTGGNKRSPFQKPISAEDALREQQSRNVIPDMNRSKEFLEQFDIGSLSYVGMMAQRNTTWALIRDSERKIHRVTVGNYLGKDNGRIKSIAEDSVELLEVVPNGIDSWLERPFKLSLQGK